MDAPAIDPSKLEAFAMRAIGDLTAGYTGVMVIEAMSGERTSVTDPRLAWYASLDAQGLQRHQAEVIDAVVATALGDRSGLAARARATR